MAQAAPATLRRTGSASEGSSSTSVTSIFKRDIAASGRSDGQGSSISNRLPQEGEEAREDSLGRQGVLRSERLQEKGGSTAETLRRVDDMLATLDSMLEANRSSADDFHDMQASAQDLWRSSQEIAVDLDGRGPDATDVAQNAQAVAQVAQGVAAQVQAPAAPVADALQNPLTKKDVLLSKAFTTDGAVTILDKVKAQAAPGKQAFLDGAIAFLETRRQSLANNTDATPLGKSDLQDLMGSTKAHQGKIDEAMETSIGQRLDAITLETGFSNLQLPESISGFREDAIMLRFLEKTLKTAGVPVPKDLPRELLKSRLDSINNRQTWSTIDKKVGYTGVNGQPKIVDSQIKPQSQLGNVYEAMNDHGVNCHMAQSYEHVTNLALTSAKVGNDTVFQGIRHGTLTAYKISPKELRKMDDVELKTMIRDLKFPGQQLDSQQVTDAFDKARDSKKANGKLATELRRLATENRGRDVATAALVSNGPLLLAALANGQGGNPPTLSLNSISLLTPVYKRGGDANERRMVADQLAAWNALKTAGTITLTVNDANGTPQQVDVRLNVKAFNFGVNAASIGGGNKFLNLGVRLPLVKAALAGWFTVNKQNRDSMNGLIGRQSERTATTFGGDVGRWIAANPTSPDLQTVKDLARQVGELYDSGDYKQAGGEPYKLVTRLAVLTDKIGSTAAWNCKSGKDRTGELDAEAKYLATQIHDNNGAVPQYERVRDDREKTNFFNMAVGGGNHEMQFRNTGAPGFKLKDAPVIANLVGDGDASPRWQQMLGLSAFYGS